MKKLIIAILIVTTSPVLSQSFNSAANARAFTSDLFILDEYIKRQNKDVNFKDTKSYKGTPYNHPNFLPGNIYKEGKLLAENIAVRYNAIADEMEVKETIASPEEDARVLTKSPDVYVKILNDIFVFVPYQGGIEEGGYFEVLQEGKKIALYKKQIKDFTPEKKATSSITKKVPAQFKDKPVYYLVTKNGKFYQLPRSRNKKLKVFGEKEKEMKKYVKTNDLNLNEEKDLLRAVTHFDTL
jgi:hypothetical protein